MDEAEYYDETAPFLGLGGRRRDGKGGTKQDAPVASKEEHRRVRSDGVVTSSSSLIRSKKEQTNRYGSVVSPTPSAPQASKNQHPLLRRKSSRDGKSSKALPRNSSFEDVKTAEALKKPVHRRASSESGLPPVAPASKGGHHRRSSSRSGIVDIYNPSRRRADSISSVVSTGSVGSIVTDITKSALFGGVTDSGVVQFNLPIDKVHILMDPELAPGTLYKERLSNEEEKYAEYQLMTTDARNNWHEYLEDGSRDGGAGGCTCQCDNCIHCTSKAELLPPTRYALVVEDDVYRRVLSEIADSKGMPCGLFFCGHHEDVSHPSIFIAVSIVSLFFLAMIVIACLP